MDPILVTAAKAAGLFAGTNIDDMVVLAVLNISSRADGRPRPWQIWAGQYAGIAALVAISLLAALGLPLVPKGWTVQVAARPFRCRTLEELGGLDLLVNHVATQRPVQAPEEIVAERPDRLLGDEGSRPCVDIFTGPGIGRAWPSGELRGSWSRVDTADPGHLRPRTGQFVRQARTVPATSALLRTEMAAELRAFRQALPN